MAVRDSRNIYILKMLLSFHVLVIFNKWFPAEGKKPYKPLKKKLLQKKKINNKNGN